MAFLLADLVDRPDPGCPLAPFLFCDSGVEDDFLRGDVPLSLFAEDVDGVMADEDPIAGVGRFVGQDLGYIRAVGMGPLHPDDEIRQVDLMLPQKALVLVAHQLDLGVFVVALGPFEVVDVPHVQGHDASGHQHSAGFRHHLLHVFPVLGVGDSFFEFHADAVGRAGDDEVNRLVGQLAHVLGVFEIDAGDIAFGKFDPFFGGRFAFFEELLDGRFQAFGGPSKIKGPLCHSLLVLGVPQFRQGHAVSRREFTVFDLGLNGCRQFQEPDLLRDQSRRTIAEGFEIPHAVAVFVPHRLDVQGDLDGVQALTLHIPFEGIVSDFAQRHGVQDDALDSFPAEFGNDGKPACAVDDHERIVTVTLTNGKGFEEAVFPDALLQRFLVALAPSRMAQRNRQCFDRKNGELGVGSWFWFRWFSFWVFLLAIPPLPASAESRKSVEWPL